MVISIVISCGDGDHFICMSDFQRTQFFLHLGLNFFMFTLTWLFFRSDSNLNYSGTCYFKLSLGWSECLEINPKFTLELFGLSGRLDHFDTKKLHELDGSGLSQGVSDWLGLDQTFWTKNNELGLGQTFCAIKLHAHLSFGMILGLKELPDFLIFICFIGTKIY